MTRQQKIERVLAAALPKHMLARVREKFRHKLFEESMQPKKNQSQQPFIALRAVCLPAEMQDRLVQMKE